MECKYCKKKCIKSGMQSNIQRYYCKQCRKYQQSSYHYQALRKETNERIKTYVVEGCGSRSMARILKISKNTVKKRILLISHKIVKPIVIVKGKKYEMDEIRTFIKKKTNRFWVAYAIRRDTKEVIDFKVGKRNKNTLKRVIDTMLLSEARKIYTDGYPLYKTLIPSELHKVSKYKINHIERKNLSIRTHLKRLARKTICYS